MLVIVAGPTSLGLQIRLIVSGRIVSGRIPQLRSFLMDSRPSNDLASGLQDLAPIPGSSSLGEALLSMTGDPGSCIPFLVRLLENPSSRFALPGNINLYRHDCLHLLLRRHFSLDDEAFVVGFTMGNDLRTNGFHLALFKFCSLLFYPKPYRFSWKHLFAFDSGLALGKKAKVRNISQVDFCSYEQQSLQSLRDWIGIS
ncbi:MULTISPECIES: hypothetical protein [unclassified Synechococcus]|uniref:hypothetical protein n=1 Tax=unclassified Synechococcus TaxID=2626047 RepID=UPI0021050318|nr:MULTISPECIES: hypothetical protein [unclassified Synechococcus]